VIIGTTRIISISRGKQSLAPLLGFVEAFIWITVVSQIVSSAYNVLAYLAYAAGFAVGNYVGMCMKERLVIGTLVVRAIVARDGLPLVEGLRKEG
jgi:uncharacterized protein YebE (UPF0316 family)